MQIVRRLTDENGLVIDQFTAMFNKPQCKGGIINCSVIPKDKEQVLTSKQEQLEVLQENSPEYIKLWLQVRKLALRAKPKNTRLRVLGYESEVKAGKRKYLTLLELV